MTSYENKYKIGDWVRDSQCQPHWHTLYNGPEDLASYFWAIIQWLIRSLIC
jgi:hypothetical protein